MPGLGLRAKWRLSRPSQVRVLCLCPLLSSYLGPKGAEPPRVVQPVGCSHPPDLSTSSGPLHLPFPLLCLDLGRHLSEALSRAWRLRSLNKHLPSANCVADTEPHVGSKHRLHPCVGEGCYRLIKMQFQIVVCACWRGVGCCEKAGRGGPGLVRGSQSRSESCSLSCCGASGKPPLLLFSLWPPRVAGVWP